ncbi:hypothetical protein [Thalassotalea ganghwensis]
MIKKVGVLLLVSCLASCFGGSKYVNEDMVDTDVHFELRSYAKAGYVDNEIDSCTIFHIGYPAGISKGRSAIKVYEANYATRKDIYRISLSTRDRQLGFISRQFSNKEAFSNKVKQIITSNSEQSNKDNLIVNVGKGLLDYMQNYEINDTQFLPGTALTNLAIDKLNKDVCLTLLSEKEPNLKFDNDGECELVFEDKRLGILEGNSCRTKVGVVTVKPFEDLAKDDAAAYEILDILSQADNRTMEKFFL